MVGKDNNPQSETGNGTEGPIAPGDKKELKITLEELDTIEAARHLPLGQKAAIIAFAYELSLVLYHNCCLLNNNKNGGY